MERAGNWVSSMIATRTREELVVSFGLMVFAAAAAFFTAFLVFGGFMMLGIVLAALEIKPPHPLVIFLVVTSLQLVVFYIVKPREEPRVSVERTEDTGELIVIKPERSSRVSPFYDQDSSSSIRAIFATIALATAIAIDRSIQHFRGAMRLRAADAQSIARIADYLSERGTKATFAEIEKQMPEADLAALLPPIEQLPGFNIVMTEPQGLTLTDNAYEAMAV